MSSFKDQLSDWKTEHKPESKGPAPVQTRKACKVISRPEQKKEAQPYYPPAALVQEETPEEVVDDADLFSAAVADIHSQSAAILAKYDATIEPGAVRVSTSQEGRPIEQDETPRARVDPEKMAFLDAMGGLGQESKSTKLQKK